MSNNISTCPSCQGTGGYHHKGCKQGLNRTLGQTIPDLACPVCLLPNEEGRVFQKRLHTAEEIEKFHPNARQGFTKEWGWTSLAAKEAHEEDERRLNAQGGSIKTKK